MPGGVWPAGGRRAAPLRASIHLQCLQHRRTFSAQEVLPAAAACCLLGGGAAGARHHAQAAAAGGPSNRHPRSGADPLGENQPCKERSAG